jgi:hypothetical protein
MQDDPLVKIATSLVDARPGVNEVLREKMISELVAAMERHINAELISRLNEEQAQEFITFLDTEPDDAATVNFFKDKGIDVTSAVTSALQNFKDAYVGTE